MKSKIPKPKLIVAKSHFGSPGRLGLGLYLKKKREEVGLTQAELARVLNYNSAQFISNWERGLAQPPHKAITKITKLLKLDVKKVIKYYSAHTEFLLMAHFKRTTNDSPVEPQEPKINPIAYPKASGE